MAPVRAQGVEQHERAPHDTHEVVYMGGGAEHAKAGQREAEELILRVRRILQRRLVIIWRAGFDRKKWTVG